MKDLSVLDNSLYEMISRVELDGETCGLKHSKEDPSENHPATNYLCQHVNDNISGEVFQLRIPICDECVEALNDPNWILAYCINCNSSQWIFRPRAKNIHPEGNGIYWCDVCPFCAEIADEYILYKDGGLDE